MLCNIAAVNSYCFNIILIWVGILASLAQISETGFLTRSTKHIGREIETKKKKKLIYSCTIKKREEEETK